MEIVYADPRIVVAVKPAGVLSTDEPGGMPQLLRQELGTPCIRTVHRLDAAVSGLDIHRDDHTWLVEGPWLQRLMGNINFSDYESRMYFDKVLRQSGLFDQLEQMGIQDGDIVSMYDLEFEYQR